MGLYRAADVRRIDARLIAAAGGDGYRIMQRAGQAAWKCLNEHWPDTRRLLVLTGAGNNGGDGWVLARLARGAGLEVNVLALRDPGALGGDAAAAARDYLAAGGAWAPFAAPTADRFTTDSEPQLIADALLGTGLDAAPRDAYAAAIEWAGRQAAPRLALDVPSGLDADRGSTPGVALRADLTVTFVAAKTGLYTGRGPDLCGRIVVAPLDADPAHRTGIAPVAELLTGDAELPPRPPTTHKGQCGHLLIAGGRPGMLGAALLAGRGALRGGAGLVTVLTHRRHAAWIALHRPELMTASWPPGWRRAGRGVIERATVIALGPGLGQSRWSKSLFRRLAADARPVVMDADSLNLLAGKGRTTGAGPPGAPRLLTPHPGEAARLLGTISAAIENDRPAAARAIAQQYQAVTILKGAGSLIAEPSGRLAVIGHGTPAMAGAGMGDVLTGLAGALLAQGLDPWHAACTAALAHARAGEVAAAGRDRGLLAGELADALPAILAGGTAAI